VELVEPLDVGLGVLEVLDMEEVVVPPEVLDPEDVVINLPRYWAFVLLFLKIIQNGQVINAK
jgi:hypothetical protein